MVYSDRIHHTLILFSVLVTLFMIVWTTWTAGGFALFILPMSVPFFIAPAIVYYLQFRTHNTLYALLLVPFAIYEFIFLLIRIASLAGQQHGITSGLTFNQVPLLGFSIPTIFQPWLGVLNGPVIVFALLLIVHSTTLGVLYAKTLWKQLILPYFLVLAIALVAIVAARSYSAAIEPDQWKLLTSENCNYSFTIHPAMSPSFGDSFGYQSTSSQDPYLCKDSFSHNARDQRASLDVYLYASTQKTLQDWLLIDWPIASTLPFSGGVGSPLITSTDEWHYQDKGPWLAYFKKEVEKLIPTGTRTTLNGYETMEFLKSDTIVLFILGPDNRVAELHCSSNSQIITMDTCRKILRSFSFKS